MGAKIFYVLCASSWNNCFCLNVLKSTEHYGRRFSLKITLAVPKLTKDHESIASEIHRFNGQNMTDVCLFEIYLKLKRLISTILALKPQFLIPRLFLTESHGGNEQTRSLPLQNFLTRRISAKILCYCFPPKVSQKFCQKKFRPINSWLNRKLVLNPKLVIPSGI